MLKSVVVATLVGSLLGFAGAHALFLGWWTLIPWGIGGLVLGYFCGKPSHAFTAGVVYGFVLVFVFMMDQYTGTIPMIRRFPFFGILAAFGAVCGIVLCFTSFFVRHRVKA